MIHRFNESCTSRYHRLVETLPAFLHSINHYRRSRALSYHDSDKTCETFAQANVSGVNLQNFSSVYLSGSRCTPTFARSTISALNLAASRGYLIKNTTKFRFFTLFICVFNETPPYLFASSRRRSNAFSKFSGSGE